MRLKYRFWIGFAPASPINPQRTSDRSSKLTNTQRACIVWAITERSVHCPFASSEISIN
jgi:hypothetical protein